VKPYYEHGGITIYHGDCREVLSDVRLDMDLVLTDPPYPDYHAERFQYSDDLLDMVSPLPCRQFVFWSAKVPFPLSHTAIHIWDKKTGCGSEYERIFERNGHQNWKVFRHYLINSTVAASYSGDEFTGHPSQKPQRLLTAILAYAGGDRVLDPFMGSGSTLRASKDLGHQAIGIEIEERYCEIAARRLQQEVLPLIAPESQQSEMWT
jgi:DNA modification methylase